MELTEKEKLEAIIKATKKCDEAIENSIANGRHGELWFAEFYEELREELKEIIKTN